MVNAVPHIDVDVRFLQPGDIIRSKVDEALRVKVERPIPVQALPSGHLCRHEHANGVVPKEHICNCRLERDHRAADNPEEKARAAARARRQQEREDAAWARRLNQ